MEAAPPYPSVHLPSLRGPAVPAPLPVRVSAWWRPLSSLLCWARPCFPLPALLLPILRGQPPARRVSLQAKSDARSGLQLLSYHGFVLVRELSAELTSSAAAARSFPERHSIRLPRLLEGHSIRLRRPLAAPPAGCWRAERWLPVEPERRWARSWPRRPALIELARVAADFPG